MGCYDTLWVDCPICGEELYFQSKSGDCSLRNYSLEDCPDDVMQNVNRHSPVKCDCGTEYEINIAERKLITVPS